MNWRQVFATFELESPDTQEGLAKLKDAGELYIEIRSGKDTINGVFAPVDTVAWYRTKETGKKTFIADCDSGEQDGLATDIPKKLAEVLKAFGLRERPNKQEGA